MGLRLGLLLSLSVVAVSATAMAQTAPTARKPTAAAPQPRKPAARSARSGDPGTPRTLAEALAATYSNQPALQAERAKLRATDENVPAALSGWRPTVVIAGSTGYGDGMTRAYTSTLNRVVNSRNDRLIGTAQATVTQNIYTGGRTQAQVNQAKNQVYAERATLLAQEQSSFSDTVSAYVGVISARQLLALQVNNEQVLAKQLQATNDRFRVGEITRTDVAQAEAALEGAKASREKAEGDLQTARATYTKVIGYDPPDDLIEPQPLALPVRTEQDAAQLASTNNPNVLTAMFNNAANKDAIDVAFSQLMPQVSVQGQTFQQQNAASRSTSTNGYAVTAQVSVPLYQGGSEYSGVRKARQTQQQSQREIENQRRIAVQAAVQAWDTLVAARAAAESTRAQIRANEVALEGVEREAIVGSRTTLDVLNATQTLLNSRTNLVTALSQVVIASYQVASAIGRLTARDLHLPVPLYDDTAYYNAVKDRWAGLGDYATDQPGR
ncbi:TolC family outer membrane protein [Rhodopila sp.]|jgi:outer membrane protein|uniref:TolC family outer membrane protein n=1 Tax=Rhodopila sp. TaxID=2480087 RepID=UPI002BD22862|nr:TolC family outer membrane protein [Rhodopila sp.]HVZ07604.1 TolC family outer membrane protein [Rhodopila sp.]